MNLFTHLYPSSFILCLYDCETEFSHLQYGKVLHFTEDMVKTKRDNPEKKIFFKWDKPLQFCSMPNTQEVANKRQFQYYIKKILPFKYIICQNSRGKCGKFCNTYDSHISGIIQYLFFGDWIISLSIMLSKFIHCLHYIRIFFPL